MWIGFDLSGDLEAVADCQRHGGRDSHGRCGERVRELLGDLDVVRGWRMLFRGGAVAAAVYGVVGGFRCDLEGLQPHREASDLLGDLRSERGTVLSGFVGYLVQVPLQPLDGGFYRFVHAPDPTLRR